MKRFNAALLACLLTANFQVNASSVFVGYEFGQMAFNGFQNFAGEVGYTLDSNATIRLSYLNVALSERHLSSSEASAVDGDNVEGLWRGVEFLYDVPINRHIFIGPSVGYFDSIYSHTELNEEIRKKSSTVGLALSYSDNGIWRFDNLYWRFSISYRHYLNPMQRTTLGDSVVNGGSSEVTPAIFVGYRFD